MARSAMTAHFCPICGSGRIVGSMDNDTDPHDDGYAEWHYIECRVCGAAGTVDFDAEESPQCSLDEGGERHE